ncbi:MAG: hypothetical protein ACAH59_13295 [Pseudobdellovibrionaceae bacterium]
MKHPSLIIFILLIDIFCLAQTESPANEPQKAIRFNYQNRFFIEADFKKPISGQFKVSSRPELEKEVKSQKAVKKYEACSMDPMVAIDAEIYHLHFYGDKDALKAGLPSGSQIKLRFQLKEDQVKNISQWKLKSKVLKVFQVQKSEDCGPSAEPLKARFNTKTLELTALCSSPKCRYSSAPLFDKTAQAELNFIIGFLEDDFIDLDEEARALKAEKALDQEKK